MDFGSRLRRLRGTRTQKQVAADLQMPITTLSTLENQQAVPRGVMLKRFGDLARTRVVANLSTLTDPSQIKEWSLILKRLDGLLPPAAAAPAGAAK